MKILSIAVPCYNSAKYMDKCIKSLLTGGEDVEILIVNDGSTDETRDKADAYEKRYPGVCRAVHQINGGHGDAVMTGLKAATGVFFKVVDSDDYLDRKSFLRVLEKLRGFVSRGESLDMMICNFIYDKEGARRKKIMHYKKVLPVDQVFSWDEIGHFLPGSYILMHSVMYRRQLLLESGLNLPKHTFYVDNIFVYQPLPKMKTIYYMDENLYRYYIGREDQSVNESVMIGRIDQQYKVTRLMLEYYDLYKIRSKKLRNYMLRYLEIMMVICSVLAIKSGEEENLQKKEVLWQEVKAKYPRLYRRLRFGFLGQSMNLPGKLGQKISVAGYKLAQKLYGFN